MFATTTMGRPALHVASFAPRALMDRGVQVVRSSRSPPVVAASKSSRRRKQEQRGEAGRKRRGPPEAPDLYLDAPPVNEKANLPSTRGFSGGGRAADPLEASIRSGERLVLNKPTIPGGGISDEVLWGEDQEPEEVEAAARTDVVQSCVATSAVLLFAALLLQQFSLNAASRLWGTPQANIEAIWDIPDGLPPGDLAVAAGIAAAVTAARFALMAVWPEFAKSTNDSNKQVLTNVGWGDLALVSALPGVTEELCFRGGLVAATSPSWKGALLSAVVFGALHKSEYRSFAFTVWAGGVGLVYGLAMLYTGDLLVPVAAHTFANLGSAVIWKVRNPSPELEENPSPELEEGRGGEGGGGADK